jgi:hypothetical protein
LPNGTAGKALKQANSETTWAAKASRLTREITQVTPEARKGKPCAKAGYKTQTNSTSDHLGGKPVKLLKVSDLEMHLTRPKSTYFKTNYGSRALSVIFKGTEATALSSKSIRLHLGHLNAVEKC